MQTPAAHADYGGLAVEWKTMRTPNDPPVTVYGQPGCQPCKAVVRYLKQHKIPFTYHDVTEEPDALKLVKDMGYDTVPVVFNGMHHFYGYNPTEMAKIPR